MDGSDPGCRCVKQCRWIYSRREGWESGDALLFNMKIIDSLIQVLALIVILSLFNSFIRNEGFGGWNESSYPLIFGGSIFILLLVRIGCSRIRSNRARRASDSSRPTGSDSGE